MFYGRDLAHTHDRGFGEFARGAAAWLAETLEPPGRVVELGCGSGITSAVLLDAGFDVVGVDLSEDLLRIARERAPGARFVRASFLDFDLPGGCLAVTAFSEVLNYLADARVGRESLRDLFTRVREALVPGGLFAFDVLEPGTEGGVEARRSWTEGDDWLVCAEVTEAGRRLNRRICAFRREGAGWSRTDETHEVLLMPREEVRADLEAVGFAVEVLDGYGSLAFRRGLAGFAARRA